jgi:hypothetical protein
MAGLVYRLCRSEMCSVHLVRFAGMDQNVDVGLVACVVI